MKVKNKYARKMIRIDDLTILPRMNKGAIPSDVLGSYTGTDADGDAPSQDADDL